MSDYISKSALLKHLWDWRLQECPVGVCDEETETYKAICECIDAVKEQPTLDEKEIIRKAFERVLEILKRRDLEHGANKNQARRSGFYSLIDLHQRYSDECQEIIKIIKRECGISE